MSHSVAVVDPCRQTTPAGHSSSMEVVGHMLPGGHNSCWVDPGKQIKPLSQGVGVEEFVSLQKKLSGHGPHTVLASARQWDTV